LDRSSPIYSGVFGYWSHKRWQSPFPAQTAGLHSNDFSAIPNACVSSLARNGAEDLCSGTYGLQPKLMKIANIVGARPNFIKMAPLLREMRQHAAISPLLVHTGQHYDARMAGQFFQDLHLPAPDISLDVGSGSHAYQTAEVMRRLEPVLEEERPDLVLVVGDVNSTLAAALTAAKLGIPVAHVEAGLRSFDRTMPEEINRLVTDAVSDYLFVTEESARQNLLREGVEERKIFFVGNVMIDALEESRQLWADSTIHHRLGLTQGEYGVVTLHRPSNVDNVVTLRRLTGALAEIADKLPVIFPVHPRTRQYLGALDWKPLICRTDGPSTLSSGIVCLEPMGYLDFMALVSSARIVLTDSGGLQEETTILGIPCLTLRENTERPVTVTHGTNQVVGMSPDRILEAALQVLENPRPPHPAPPLWDGKTSSRVVSVLLEHLRSQQPAKG
jgi:UDP-N-acetylglucosamine 2-epimerase (non-hydrolysing)